MSDEEIEYFDGEDDFGDDGSDHQSEDLAAVLDEDDAPPTNALSSSQKIAVKNNEEVGAKDYLDSALQFAINQGYIAGTVISEKRTVVTVGFYVGDLDEDILAGSGIDPEKRIYARFTFDGDAQAFLRQKPSVEKKEIEIRQSSEKNYNLSKFNEEIQFGLWWTLEQRLSEWISANWNTISERQNKIRRQTVEVAKKYNFHIADEIAENAAQMADAKKGTYTRYFALAALESEGSKDEALMALIDDGALKRFQKKAAEIERKIAQEVSTEPFLSDVVEHLRSVIVNAPLRCIVCGDRQPLALLKPVACSKDLCNFQQIEFGLGVVLEAELLHRPLIVDLLISLTYAGASSSRNFEPFPKIEVTRVDKSKLPWGHNKYTIKDGVDCALLLKKCPKVAKLAEFVKSGTLVAELEKLDPRLYTLLRWIVATNRSHLKVLEDQLPVKAAHQLILKSTPPEKEKKFQELKKQHGSFWAWHGSSIGNWHSILRNGLKNFSGTAKQANGAAYGPGIYMAVDSGTSLSYSSMMGVGDYWKDSNLGQPVTCLALCEVIAMGSATNCIGGVHRPNCSHCKGAPYYRIEDEDCVVTRFLFVYKAGSSDNVQAMDLAKTIEQHRDMLRASSELKKPK